MAKNRFMKHTTEAVAPAVVPEEKNVAVAEVEDHQMGVEEVISKVAPATAMAAPGANPDFRGLPDPERTFARLNFVLRDKTLLPVFKIAAAVLVQSFLGNDTHIQFVKMKELLPEAEGFSSRAKSGMLGELKARGLIEQEQVHRKGMKIRILF